MTETPTERYIAAAVRSLPAASRSDVQTELEVSIADAIEARTDQGEEHISAERIVLTDLGDPRELAARYSDQPLYLIGPRFYLLWWELLKLLWIIVPTVAMVGVAFAKLLDEAPIREIVGSTVGTGISSVVLVAFWVTLVFAVLERTVKTSTSQEWDLTKLPQIQPKGAGRGEVIAALIFLVLGVGVLLWDQTRGVVYYGPEPFSVLNPGLWPWWSIGLMALMAAAAALTIAVYLNGRWKPVFAVLNTAVALVFAVCATTLLATGNLINPEFITLVFAENGVNADSLRTLGIITGVCLVGFPLWSIIDGWQKSARDSRR